MDSDFPRLNCQEGAVLYSFIFLFFSAFTYFLVLEFCVVVCFDVPALCVWNVVRSPCVFFHFSSFLMEGPQLTWFHRLWFLLTFFGRELLCVLRGHSSFQYPCAIYQMCYLEALLWILYVFAIDRSSRLYALWFMWTLSFFGIKYTVLNIPTSLFSIII